MRSHSPARSLSRVFLALIVVSAVFFTVAFAAQKGDDKNEFTQSEIEREVVGFFDKTTTGLAEVVEKAFKDYGRPNGYIKGAEGGGAIFVGLRYGEGELIMKRGVRQQTYWQGPSFGLDFGGNISKAFILVYNLRDADDLFQRFPGVEGSAYLVGGASLNYQRSGDVILAPIRTGVGLRLGANIGYMHFTREKHLNPF